MVNWLLGVLKSSSDSLVLLVKFPVCLCMCVCTCVRACVQVSIVSPSPYESFESGGAPPLTDITHPRMVPTTKYTAGDEAETQCLPLDN